MIKAIAAVMIAALTPSAPMAQGQQPVTPPHMEAEAFCGDADSQAEETACLALEQKAYDTLYEMWPSVSPEIGAGCGQATAPLGSYAMLHACVVNAYRQNQTAAQPAEERGVSYGKPVSRSSAGDVSDIPRGAPDPWNVEIRRPVDPSQMTVIGRPQR